MYNPTDYQLKKQQATFMVKRIYGKNRRRRYNPIKTSNSTGLSVEERTREYERLFEWLSTQISKYRKDVLYYCCCRALTTVSGVLSNSMHPAEGRLISRSSNTASLNCWEDLARFVMSIHRQNYGSNSRSSITPIITSRHAEDRYLAIMAQTTEMPMFIYSDTRRKTTTLTAMPNNSHKTMTFDLTQQTKSANAKKKQHFSNI